ncbi:MAG: ThuA domain-containing protein, partial [Flavobacteriaceae bacterium]
MNLIRRNTYGLLVIILIGLVLIGCQNKREGNPKVLVFYKTMGFKHESIPAGIAAIQELGEAHNFEVDTTRNALLFDEDNLKRYAAIIFLSTTGDVLDHLQEAAFERYIQAGGGFVGIHAATDTEYDWNWYGRLVGAYFESHPPGVTEAAYHIKDADFAATSIFADTIWHRTDEMYNFKKINPDVHVIMTIDESTYEGGTNGAYHPMSWYHEYDGGRSFYTALGHTNESFSDELYLKHILGGIQYAIGENLELEYKKASSQIPPDQDRFSKEVLTIGKFYEPTEMTILPNNDVLIAQRRGELMLYQEETGELEQIASLDVYHTSLEKPGLNVENGLMGLQKDPDYLVNHWIYLYYSPAGTNWVNRLSRFKYFDGEFDVASEQVILEVETDREVCCHTGGSIAFGPDKLLYLSTGDNSTPFDEIGVPFVNHGFAPLNDIPGKQNFDAARSSGNSNDLRGKVLRIKVNDDGTYDIPAQNLFPIGTAKTRPEIYTMGHRNPYRISVDQKNGNLYWGDVGPDAQGDSLATRGPRGYDEVNQATEAGNFGWPFFIADNQPYVNYDYQTGKSGEAFDPDSPVNNSANNSGITELPRAMPAFVYYPYAPTAEFPQIGTGGRNAMAGPVFYSDQYDGADNLPAYFDGKLLIYDWMRGWMKAVSFFEDGAFNKMEPFANGVEINSLIDMEMGPDGRLYLLEYGTGWFTANPDSGLSYIAYNGGNRPPVIDHLIVDKDSGGLPLKINLETKARDREKDPITYIWDLGDGTTSETEEAQLSHEYIEAGEYEVSVSVKDSHGAVARS